MTIALRHSRISLRHYQRLFAFINEVRGFPLPKLPDEDIEPIIAYMRAAF